MLEAWLYLLNDAFTNHGQEPTMQEVGCRCLARLLEIRPYLIEIIGDDKERYQYVSMSEYFRFWCTNGERFKNH